MSLRNNENAAGLHRGFMKILVSDTDRVANVHSAWMIVQQCRNANVQSGGGVQSGSMLTTNVMNALLECYIKGEFAEYSVDMLQQY